MKQNSFTIARNQMVDDLKKNYEIKNKAVLDAMKKVGRHLFVPENFKEYAYTDGPLEIGFGQTISQPFIVAFMTEIVELNENSKVLEIGTGSGYQTAILAEICKEVYTIELIKSLSISASELLTTELKYKNIKFKISDGYKGWEDESNFDAIIVTAAAKNIPPKLLEQLKVGGRMIIPLGNIEDQQTLVKIIKISKNNDYDLEELFDVRFVPMVKKENII